MDCKSLLIGGVAAMLTVGTVKAQIYHEVDKEDLRAFMRQGTNWQKLGLTVEDTLSWYDDEIWVLKLTFSEVGWDWDETENIQRISDIFWGPTIFTTPIPAFTSLNLEGNLKLSSPILWYLHCGQNALTGLDVSKNVKLTDLYCCDNNLTELDVSNNIELTFLGCFENNLTELNINNLTKLRTLWCGENNLTELDLSNNAELEELTCYINNLTELDLSQHTKLRHILCYNNKLKFSTLTLSPLYLNNMYFSGTPQDTIDGGTIAYTDTVDLSSEYLINGYNFEGNDEAWYPTQYHWYVVNDDGTLFSIGGEHFAPINKNGVFTFTEYHNNKKLLCILQNESSPIYLLYYKVEIKTDNIEDEDEINFAILPNPAKTQLTICHSKEISSILLYDVAGKLLKTYTVKEINPTLDISDLSNGVYFITVDGKSVKFIKE